MTKSYGNIVPGANIQIELEQRMLLIGWPLRLIMGREHMMYWVLAGMCVLLAVLLYFFG